MRIALVSTPYVPVPPIGYGGTELVVAELVTNAIVHVGTPRSPSADSTTASFTSESWTTHLAWSVDDVS